MVRISRVILVFTALIIVGGWLFTSARAMVSRRLSAPAALAGELQHGRFALQPSPASPPLMDRPAANNLAMVDPPLNPPLTGVESSPPLAHPQIPETPASQAALDQKIVRHFTYKSLDYQKDLQRLRAQYADKAKFELGQSTVPGVLVLIVDATDDIQAEIRGAVRLLSVQETDPNALPPSNVEPRTVPILPNPNSQRVMDSTLITNLPVNPSPVPLEGAVKLFRGAQNAADKTAARESLRKILVQNFTADMAARAVQVAEIEARLTKLRRQYEAREQVRDEIIDLQLKVLENDSTTKTVPVDVDLQDPKPANPQEFPKPTVPDTSPADPAGALKETPAEPVLPSPEPERKVPSLEDDPNAQIDSQKNAPTTPPPG